MCAALYAGGCGRWVQHGGFEISIVAVVSLQSATGQRSWITEFDEKYLRQFILEDKLGICADLEKQMEELVGTYFCGWTEATKSPERSKRFLQFANTTEMSKIPSSSLRIVDRVAPARKTSAGRRGVR